MRNPDLKKTNRLGLLLLIVGLVLALILMSLPLYRFNAAVYIKKSPNTFVGDEKYLAVKEEVETVAESYRAQGFDVQLDEDVLTRVNSKGETTSLITFTINESFSKNVFSFLGSGLPSEAVLILILAMMALAPLCALLGCRGEMDLPQRYLPRRSTLLHQRLVETGHDSTLYLLRGADHGGPEFWTDQILDIVENFMRRCFG